MLESRDLHALRLKNVLRQVFPRSNVHRRFKFKMGKWSTWRHLRGEPLRRSNIQSIIERFKRQNRGRLQDPTCLLDPYEEAKKELQRKYFRTPETTTNCCSHCKKYFPFEMPSLENIVGDYTLTELRLADFEECVYYIEKLREFDKIK